jgi:hypothetical protein
MKNNNGGPAFPRNGHPDKNDFPSIGMSLRDYFAAKAMCGLVANSNLKGAKSSHISNDAYQIADAMLAAREE